MSTDTPLAVENAWLRADVAAWKREAEKMRKSRDKWRVAYGLSYFVALGIMYAAKNGLL